MNSFKFLLCVIMTSRFGASGFLLDPASITQAEGVVATFLCQYPQAIGLNWIVNETALNRLNLAGVIDSSLPLRDDRTNSVIITDMLNVTAYARYNNTKVRCFATLLNGTRYWTELSSTATLTVQGILMSIDEVKSKCTTAITISWKPPFSLNLSTAEPDVAYCIDVYNASSRESPFNHLISNCTVTTPEFSFAIENPDPRHSFKFIITPRSNVVGARNGTPSEVTKNFAIQRPLLISDPNVTVLVAISSDSETATINLFIDGKSVSGKLLRLPQNYSVVIDFLSPPQPKLECPTIMITNHSVLLLQLVCPQELMIAHLALLNVTASNEAGSTIIILNHELTTHYLQNITVSIQTFYTKEIIVVKGNFIENANVKGCLVILYSVNSSFVHYEVIERVNASGFNRSISIPGGEYNVSFFSLDNNGLPFSKAATLPKSITPLTIDSEWDSQLQDDNRKHLSVTIIRRGDDICVACTLLEDSVKSCIIVIHPTYMYLRTLQHGLLNIGVRGLQFKTHYRSQINTVSECVQNLSASSVDYHIAVFTVSNSSGVIEGHPIKKLSIKGEMKSPSNPRKEFVAVYSVPTFVLVVLAILGMTLTSLAIRKSGTKTQNVQCHKQHDDKIINMRHCCAYEVTTLTFEVTVKDNPCYDVVTITKSQQN